MFITRIEIPAFGPITELPPFTPSSAITCITGTPASGRTSALRALSCLGHGAAPDPVLDYPRHLYPLVRSDHRFAPALKARVAHPDPDEPTDIVCEFSAHSSTNPAVLPVVHLSSHLDPTPLLSSALLSDDLSPEERRMGRECLAASLGEDLSLFSSRSVGVSVDNASDPSTNLPWELRIHDPMGAYSVPVQRAGSGLCAVVSLLAFAQSLRSSEPSLVLIDDLGSGLHPDLGPGILALLNQRLADRHQVIYTTVSPAFLPSDPSMLLTLPEPARRTAPPFHSAAPALAPPFAVPSRVPATQAPAELESSSGAPSPAPIRVRVPDPDPHPPAEATEAAPEDHRPAALDPIVLDGPALTDYLSQLGTPDPALSSPPADPVAALHSESDLVAQILSPYMISPDSGPDPEDRVDPASYLEALDAVLALPFEAHEIDPSIGLVRSIESAFGPFDRLSVARAFSEQVSSVTS